MATLREQRQAFIKQRRTGSSGVSSGQQRTSQKQRLEQRKEELLEESERLTQREKEINPVNGSITSRRQLRKVQSEKARVSGELSVITNALQQIREGQDVTSTSADNILQQAKEKGISARSRKKDLQEIAKQKTKQRNETVTTTQASFQELDNGGFATIDKQGVVRAFDKQGKEIFLQSNKDSESGIVIREQQVKSGNERFIDTITKKRDDALQPLLDKAISKQAETQQSSFKNFSRFDVPDYQPGLSVREEQKRRFKAVGVGIAQRGISLVESVGKYSGTSAFFRQGFKDFKLDEYLQTSTKQGVKDFGQTIREIKQADIPATAKAISYSAVDLPILTYAGGKTIQSFKAISLPAGLTTGQKIAFTGKSLTISFAKQLSVVNLQVPAVITSAQTFSQARLTNRGNLLESINTGIKPSKAIQIREPSYTIVNNQVRTNKPGITVEPRFRDVIRIKEGFSGYNFKFDSVDVSKIQLNYIPKSTPGKITGSKFDADYRSLTIERNIKSVNFDKITTNIKTTGKTFNLKGKTNIVTDLGRVDKITSVGEDKLVFKGRIREKPLTMTLNEKNFFSPSINKAKVTRIQRTSKLLDTKTFELQTKGGDDFVLQISKTASVKPKGFSSTSFSFRPGTLDSGQRFPGSDFKPTTPKDGFGGGGNTMFQGLSKNIFSDAKLGQSLIPSNLFNQKPVSVVTETNILRFPPSARGIIVQRTKQDTKQLQSVLSTQASKQLQKSLQLQTQTQVQSQVQSQVQTQVQQQLQLQTQVQIQTQVQTQLQKQITIPTSSLISRGFGRPLPRGGGGGRFGLPTFSLPSGQKSKRKKKKQRVTNNSLTYIPGFTGLNLGITSDISNAQLKKLASTPGISIGIRPIIKRKKRR